MANPQSMLPLSPAVLHIMLALADGERHGYGVMQEVERLTAGELTMGPGTLYGSFKRMLRAELIEESDERPDPEIDDKRRRYYRLTEFGLRVVRAEAQRLENVVRQARAKALLPQIEGAT